MASAAEQDSSSSAAATLESLVRAVTTQSKALSSLVEASQDMSAKSESLEAKLDALAERVSEHNSSIHALAHCSQRLDAVPRDGGASGVNRSEILEQNSEIRSSINRRASGNRLTVASSFGPPPSLFALSDELLR